jgi:hypothetical protein
MLEHLVQKNVIEGGGGRNTFMEGAPVDGEQPFRGVTREFREPANSEMATTDRKEKGNPNE